jgi:ketosteroid isomerase-like protein
LKGGGRLSQLSPFRKPHLISQSKNSPIPVVSYPTPNFTYRNAKEIVSMLRLFTLVLLVSSLALPQTATKTEGDESQIIAFENLWNQMQIAHDADAMDQLLDPDFVLTDYDGAVLNKAQFLASLRDRSNQLTVEVSQDMKLHRHGDTVVVIGATHEKGTLKGKPYEHHGRFTDTWIKRDYRWLCAASQLALIPKSL